MTRATIYTTATCPYCVRAKDLLDRQGIDYEEIRVDIHPEKLAEMLARSNHRRTVPQIFINDRHIGGCDALYAAFQSGQLDDIIRETGASK